jgi:hypothetical protein
MRGGALPPALLAAALGLALAFRPGRIRGLDLAAFLLAAIAASLLPLSPRATDGVFAALWSMTIGLALSVHLPEGLRRPWATLPAAAGAGLACGAAVAFAGTWADLARSLPAVAVLAPAAIAVRRGGGVGVKVVASWLAAVALLALTLQLLPVTPGYLPDHLE